MVWNEISEMKDMIGIVRNKKPSKRRLLTQTVQNVLKTGGYHERIVLKKALVNKINKVVLE